LIENFDNQLTYLRETTKYIKNEGKEEIGYEIELVKEIDLKKE
jgi:hypothetical protein